MKPRCIKKPFDVNSWCDRCCVNDVLTLNSDSFFMNLIHNVNIELCCLCVEKIQDEINEKHWKKL
jgi:hypothetical protein